MLLRRWSKAKYENLTSERMCTTFSEIFFLFHLRTLRFQRHVIAKFLVYVIASPLMHPKSRKFTDTKKFYARDSLSLILTSHLSVVQHMPIKNDIFHWVQTFSALGQHLWCLPVKFLIKNIIFQYFQNLIFSSKNQVKNTC